MSEEVGAVVDPDIPQEPPPVAAAEPPVDPPAPEPDEDAIPEAVEVQPGVRVVPVGVVKALRDEIKALKPQAQRAHELEQEVNQSRPYVDFLRNNQHLLQPQPAAPAPPQGLDPGLEEVGKAIDLWGLDGQVSAQKIGVLDAYVEKKARAIAEQMVAPLQEATHKQQAAANVQNIMQTTKVGGKPMDPQYLKTAIQAITASPDMSHADKLRILADPNVAGLIKRVAQGLQAEAMGAAAPPVPVPADPPLHRESAGGGSDQIVLNENSKRLARVAGISEKDFVDRARKYVPGRSNVLE